MKIKTAGALFLFQALAAGAVPARAAVRFHELELRLVAVSGGALFPRWSEAGTVSLEPEVLFSGKDFESIEASQGGDDGKTPSLALHFTKEAGRRFERETTRSTGRRLAVVVAGKVVVAPKILHPISTGLFEITGPSAAEIREMDRAIEGESGAEKVPAHMIDTWYHFRKPGPFYRMDMNFVWEKGPADEHIYEGFDFEFRARDKAKGTNHAQGYTGPQIYFKKKRVLFSIWNAEDGAVTADLVSGHCTRFTGEGDGVHCDAPYEWIPGREYRLTVERAAEDADGEVWAGSITDVKAGERTEIGRIRLKNVFGYKGYGGLDDAAAVFTEYVHDRPRTCASQPYVRMKWEGPFIENGAFAAVVSKTIYPEGCANSNASSPGRPVLIHEAGADVSRTGKTNVDVWSAPAAR